MNVKKKYCKKNKLNKIYENKLMAFFALKKSIKVIFFNYLKLLKCRGPPLINL